MTRGVIGVQIGEVTSDDYQVLGLDALRGVIVSTVTPDGPADEAGIESGDFIVAYAGEPVEDSLDLQRRVVGTRPRTGVAVDVVRNGEPVTLDVTIGELNLDAESRSVMAAVAEETSEGFGITLQDLTSQMMRRLGVPDDTVGAVVADVASGEVPPKRAVCSRATSFSGSTAPRSPRQPKRTPCSTPSRRAGRPSSSCNAATRASSCSLQKDQ